MTHFSPAAVYSDHSAECRASAVWEVARIYLNHISYERIIFTIHLSQTWSNRLLSSCNDQEVADPCTPFPGVK